MTCSEQQMLQKDISWLLQGQLFPSAWNGIRFQST